MSREEGVVGKLAPPVVWAWVQAAWPGSVVAAGVVVGVLAGGRSEEHTSELQSHRDLHSFPTRRSSDLVVGKLAPPVVWAWVQAAWPGSVVAAGVVVGVLAGG